MLLGISNLFQHVVADSEWCSKWQWRLTLHLRLLALTLFHFGGCAAFRRFCCNTFTTKQTRKELLRTPPACFEYFSGFFTATDNLVRSSQASYETSSDDSRWGCKCHWYKFVILTTRQSAVVAVRSARFPSEWCYHSICCDASMKPQLNAIHHVTTNCTGLARQDWKWQAEMHTSSTHEHTHSW